MQFRAQIIHIMNEVSSRIYLKALIYRNLFFRGANELFFEFENILDGPRFPGVRAKVGINMAHRQRDGYASTEGSERVSVH